MRALARSSLAPGRGRACRQDDEIVDIGADHDVGEIDRGVGHRVDEAGLGLEAQNPGNARIGDVGIDQEDMDIVLRGHAEGEVDRGEGLALWDWRSSP